MNEYNDLFDEDRFDDEPTAAFVVNQHGQAAVSLIPKIARERVFQSEYWKQHCFSITEETLLEKAIDLKYISGLYGANLKVTPFLCLLMKLLNIEPSPDIIMEYIQNEDFKYVRALGMFYLRLMGTSLEIYRHLEPLYTDFRKIRKLNPDASYEMTYIDELVDQLLNDTEVIGIPLPRLQKRAIFEEQGVLEKRVTPLANEIDNVKISNEEIATIRAQKEAERKASEERPPSPTAGDGSSLSLEATNALRAKLGLKPLVP